MIKKSGQNFSARAAWSSASFLAVCSLTTAGYCADYGIIGDNSKASLSIKVSVAPQMTATAVAGAGVLCFRSNTATGAYRLSGDGIAALGADGQARTLDPKQMRVASTGQSPCAEPSSAITRVAAPGAHTTVVGGALTLLVAPL